MVIAIIMLTSLLLTSMAVVREREIGTMEQLMVTPIRPAELILGKTLTFALIGFVDVLLITAVAVFWFTVPIKGSLLLLFRATALYLLSPFLPSLSRAGAPRARSLELVEPRLTEVRSKGV